MTTRVNGWFSYRCARGGTPCGTGPPSAYGERRPEYDRGPPPDDRRRDYERRDYPDDDRQRDYHYR